MRNNQSNKVNRDKHDIPYSTFSNTDDSTQGKVHANYEEKETSKIQQRYGRKVLENWKFYSIWNYLFHSFCIPPIFVKLTITKTKNLGKNVQPSWKNKI